MAKCFPSETNGVSVSFFYSANANKVRFSTLLDEFNIWQLHLFNFENRPGGTKQKNNSSLQTEYQEKKLGHFDDSKQENWTILK